MVNESLLHFCPQFLSTCRYPRYPGIGKVAKVQYLRYLSLGKAREKGDVMKKKLLNQRGFGLVKRNPWGAPTLISNQEVPI